MLLSRRCLFTLACFWSLFVSCQMVRWLVVFSFQFNRLRIHLVSLGHQRISIIGTHVCLLVYRWQWFDARPTEKCNSIVRLQRDVTLLIFIKIRSLFCTYNIPVSNFTLPVVSHFTQLWSLFLCCNHYCYYWMRGYWFLYFHSFLFIHSEFITYFLVCFH